MKNDSAYVAVNLDKPESSLTATPWTVDGDDIFSDNRLIMTCRRVYPLGIDDRQAGESWLEMRDRTQAARDAVVSETRDRAAFVVRACSEYDELKLKATHYDWLLNEARKTGVTVRFFDDGKVMRVSGGIIEESVVDELVEALQAMLDCADSDDFNGAPSNAVYQQARSAIAKASR